MKHARRPIRTGKSSRTAKEKRALPPSKTRPSAKKNEPAKQPVRRATRKSPTPLPPGVFPQGTIAQPVLKGNHIQRVGIIFAGGPAPGANAVISSAAISFLDTGREVIGFQDGYRHLEQYHPVTYRLKKGIHYRNFAVQEVTGVRNTQGILIKTSRANPGSEIRTPRDLSDPKRSLKLHNCYSALVDLGIDGLISIGGDDTLKTANLLHEFQKKLPKNAKRIQVIHLPKTIDNDYKGIDFTFGYFTAVDFLAKEVKNLRADAEASNRYFIAQAMGRKAGWLSYGVGIAGEANMIFSVEDIDESLLLDDIVRDKHGKKRKEKRLRVEGIVDKIVDMMIWREEREGKLFGTVVLAEGLAELLPEKYIGDIDKDEHGHISIGKIDMGYILAHMVEKEYTRRTGRKRKVTGLQIGYEARCALPHAFDVMLGSQLGIGAYRALVEENLSGFMVSTSGQLDLHYVPFRNLVNPKTLKTEVRYLRPGSDFHRLARFLESRTERGKINGN
ncbi:MAG: 6-phosphofructokinase [Candidatus Eisenbacteria bacterium]|uniref:6-phosphofructokinase n=1 Tax=Eiseniibacteriota bacterium TaxID=2212470 RepID=A0A948W5Z4_UNCEI|nr:6-phosphofructokinase [Candidatus Eisenbacteria bacterium]